MSALKYWVWLCTVPGLSNRSRWLLLDHFTTAEEIYYADEGELRLVEDLPPEQLDKLTDRSLERAEAILTDCAAKEIFVLTAQDAAYPARLRSIYDAPVLLYGKGSMPLFDEEAAIAMVGTRKCTPYGTHAAEDLGFQLAKQGAIVVSGLARGIDSASQMGALRAGGFVAAVLGCGVDVVYPASSRRLYEDIARRGVLLSEYPPGTTPDGWRFPQRNRIISGLSVATVVVEAPEKSGALITANLALEQGRDVFAVPGPVDAPDSRGCNRLIQEGAGLVMDGWDILREYQERFPHRLRPDSSHLPPMPEEDAREEASAPAKAVEETKAEEKPAAPARPVLDLTRGTAGLADDQILVLGALDTQEGRLTDEVAEDTGLPVRRVLSALTILEIDGYVRQQGTRRFVRTVDLKITEEKG